MKLVIQIPCYNEEATLNATLSSLPRKLPGITEIEWLIVDDGSLDGTIKVAEAFGVHQIVKFPKNRGLARAFMAGLEASLAAGADIVVNLDADNQYCADDIPKLVQPILEGRAEMVVGSRQIDEIRHFSFWKKRLQRLGSWLVRVASNTDVADAPSGFRAMSRNAALRLNVFNEYTYTLETVIQAGRRGITVLSVPIRTNEQLRPSKLVKSTFDYVMRSILTILRIFMIYCPMRFFLFLGVIPFSLGVLLGIRWLILFWNIHPASHIPSLVLTAILLIFGLQLWVVGLIANLQAVNRSLLEDIQLRVRQSQISYHPNVPRPTNLATLTNSNSSLEVGLDKTVHARE
jgi:glycosyltransferase involved in cell wall biosynthesis